MATTAYTLTLRDRVRWILGHWAVYRGEVPVLLGLTLANAVVLVAYPFLLKRIIDGIQASLSPAFLWGQVGMLFGLGVLHFLIYAVMQYRRARINLRFEYSLRLRAFEFVLNQTVMPSTSNSTHWSTETRCRPSAHALPPLTGLTRKACAWMKPCTR
jgi:ABC-type multidrug transport system fused ATPase/permease subunit